MSAEITKKIEEKYPYENQTPEMIAINACKREGAEFGYQLAQEEFKKFTLLKSPPTTTSDGTAIEPSQDKTTYTIEIRGIKIYS